MLLHDELSADAIVVETNQGGDMAVHVITTAAEKLHRAKKRATPHITVVRVHASRGKRARAEAPPRSTSRAGCITCGASRSSEDQLTTWDASDGTPSPDRLDALVWALTWLLLLTAPPRPSVPRRRLSGRSLDATPATALRTTPTKTTTDPVGILDTLIRRVTGEPAPGSGAPRRRRRTMSR